MILAVRPLLDVAEIVTDREAQERIEPVAEDPVVHLVAVVLPVVEQRPWEVAHLARGVARRRREVHLADQVGTRAATYCRRLAVEPFGNIGDEGRPPTIEISEKRLAEAESVRAKQRR